MVFPKNSKKKHLLYDSQSQLIPYERIAENLADNAQLPISTKTKARNLLERLRNFEDETLRFLASADIPFKNNQGKRDIRMNKIQQKVSGYFRSEECAKYFA